MKHKFQIFICVIILFASLFSCENREINEEEGPNFSEIHEDIQYNFDEVEINGLKYLILERDRNNPHEGFGFMALKGESNRHNQDTIKAYLKTMIELQNTILAKLNNQSMEEQEVNSQLLFEKYYTPTVINSKIDSATTKRLGEGE